MAVYCAMYGDDGLCTNFYIALMCSRFVVFLLISCGLLFANEEFVQDSAFNEPVDYEIDSKRLAIIGGTVAGSYTAIYLVFLKEGWWAQAEKFRFEEVKKDFSYASNLDKFGHFYTGALFSELFTFSYDWIGFKPFTSTLLAGVSVAFTQLLVEFKDGFSPYGYSIYDAMAGSLGGFYAMARRYVPAMQYVDYKFAYFPTCDVYWNSVRKSGGEDRGGSLTGGDGVFVDDYYGGNQTHWLSFKVAKLLPEGAREFYPEWLAFAFGWGIDDGRFTRGDSKSRYEFYFSPDYDFEAIFHPQKTWSRNLVRVLNFIKFPAPVFRFGREPKFILFHPWYGVSFNL